MSSLPMARLGPGVARWTRRPAGPAWPGVMVLALFVLVFLRTPLAKLADHYYTPVDFIQSHSLTNAEPGYRVRNVDTGDPAVVLHPWLLFNRARIQAGELPLWNPYNGGGVPHLANYQSAVFSPYTLPFYLLNLHWAFATAAFLKLFGLGSFTYLSLRLIGVQASAALIGALAFTFCGHTLLWLGYHNAESAIVLPAGLYFSERLFRRYRATFGSPPLL